MPLFKLKVPYGSGATLLRDAVATHGDGRDATILASLTPGKAGAHVMSSRTRFSAPVEKAARAGVARAWKEDGVFAAIAAENACLPGVVAGLAGGRGCGSGNGHGSGSAEAPQESAAP